MLRPQRCRPGAEITLGGVRFRYVACLKRDAFSENHLLEDPTGKRQVLKISQPLGFLAERERTRYRRVAGIEGIPRLGPAQGEQWITHEYVEGTVLNYRTCKVRDDFYDRLEEIVRAVHARGMIYLDLSKRANVIVQLDGSPALIDFQISLLFGRRGPPPPGSLAGRVFAMLARADLYQVYKHRRRHGHARDDEDERLSREKHIVHRFHRSFLRDPWLAFRRRFLPNWW